MNFAQNCKEIVGIIGMCVFGIITLFKVALKSYIEKVFMTPAKRIASDISIGIILSSIFAMIYAFAFNDESLAKVIPRDILFWLGVVIIILSIVGWFWRKKDKKEKECLFIISIACFFIGMMCINIYLCNEKNFWDSAFIGACIGVMTGTIFWIIVEEETLANQKKKKLWIEHEKYGTLFVSQGMVKKCVLCEKNLDGDNHVKQYVILDKSEMKDRLIYYGEFSQDKLINIKASNENCRKVKKKKK